MTLRTFKRTIWYPISVSIERRLRKIRIVVDRTYRKIWKYILATFVICWISITFPLFKKDYDLLSNYAHFETLSKGIYSTWNSDGMPGTDPK